MLYPTADRLLAHCDAVLRLPGESAGADQDVATARRRGLPVYHDVAEFPAAPRRRPCDGRPGVDAPDHRGRTGLHLAGRDLDRNPDVQVRDVELTSQGWHVLRRTTFDYRRRDGRWETQQRETYDRGNGAVVLPYDTERGCVLLTRQFRYPAYVNDHPDGMLDRGGRRTARRGRPARRRSAARAPRNSASTSARSPTSSTPT